MGRRWDRMVDQAYDRKARQYSGLILSIHAFFKALPALMALVVLGSLVWAVHWGWTRLPHGTTMLLTLAAVPVTLVAARAFRNRGVPVPRPLVYAASGVLVFAAIASVTLR